MTAAEIQQRVDAWLAARTSWVAAENRRVRLFTQWHVVRREFGADCAAAVGVLLALVREAWGDPTIHMRYHDCTWWPSHGGGLLEGEDEGPESQLGRMFTSEAEALVAALEAAP